MTGILLIESNKHLRENVALNLTTTGGYQVYAYSDFSNIPSVNCQLVLLPGKDIAQFQQSQYANLPYILTSSGSIPDTASDKYLGKVLIQQLPVQSVAEKVRLLLY